MFKRNKKEQMKKELNSDLNVYYKLLREAKEEHISFLAKDYKEKKKSQDRRIRHIREKIEEVEKELAKLK